MRGNICWAGLVVLPSWTVIVEKYLLRTADRIKRELAISMLAVRLVVPPSRAVKVGSGDLTFIPK